jgi:predicted phosphodiesterase
VPGTGAARRLEIFAVDVDLVQVCWSDLPLGTHTLSVTGGPTLEVEGGGPGGALIDGLRADSEVEVSLGGARATARTLAPPQGPELARIATISDLHFGERRFGRWPRIRPGAEWRDAAEPYPVVCTRAAVREAIAWGAQLIVVKGDLTDEDYDDEYDSLGAVLAAVPVPVVVIPGNHDGGDRSNGDGVAVLARHGIEMTTGVRVVDFPGLRVVVASSRQKGAHRGNLTPLLPEIIDALSGAPGGAMLATHHPPFRTGITTIWPPGIIGLDGPRLLRGVANAHPATLITGGHTHRNRRRDYRGMPITEVGSPKDFPGVWAGYAAHDGGIRQVVRRTSDPTVMSWTEQCAGTLMGWWRYWSRGNLGDRCFSHAWPITPPRRVTRSQAGRA